MNNIFGTMYPNIRTKCNPMFRHELTYYVDKKKVIYDTTVVPYKTSDVPYSMSFDPEGKLSKITCEIYSTENDSYEEELRHNLTTFIQDTLFSLTII